jgi:hypothetical protein
MCKFRFAILKQSAMKPHLLVYYPALALVYRTQ